MKARSTGPRTPAGKARSAQNARRHGLSLPVTADPDWSPHVAELAEAIAGPNASPRRRAAAARMAEADIDLARIRHLRRDTIDQMLIDATLPAPPHVGQAHASAFRRLRRYERRAFSRRNTAIRDLDALVEDTVS